MMTNKTRGNLDFGPFRLEGEPYRLWRGSVEIALRPKSLKVLAYLARRPGRLVTKEELREQVWGTSHVSDTRLRVTVLEDLHWSDVATMDLLSSIAQRRQCPVHGEPVRAPAVGPDDQRPTTSRSG